ncbi:MAG TPA: hypothetical protein VK306_03960 [Acidimicrobiales bacterium]|nr:hypothetical protein [Acidimicrobiales bacterium]
MAKRSDVDSPENIIRRYLLFVEDPKHLRDEREIQARTQAVLDAKDPIDKLKALSELERVATVDEAPLREGFVAHAKAWADDEGIPVSAFRELAVDDDVLRAAGFEVRASPTRRRRPAVEARTTRTRAKSVPVEQIKAHVLGQRGTFVLTDVQAAVGGSPATVRKAVEELVEAGDVTRVGPVPGHQGRGRAPIQYARR